MKRGAIALCIVSLTACGNDKSAVRIAFEPTRIETREVRRVGNVMYLRVYADQEYRRQITNWRRHLDRIVTRANRVTEPELGVTLEIKEALDWERKEPIGDDLSAALGELETLDPAEDVDFVAGLVTALPIFTPDTHQLGLAELFGRHFVMRGMHDPTELDKLREWGDDADQVYDERIAHRTVAVLIHELGHNLGGIHLNRSETFMSPHWTKEQHELDPRNLELMQLVVRHRLHKRGTKKLESEAAAELRAMLATAGWELHDRYEIERAKSLLEGGALANKPERNTYDRAVRVMEDGHAEEAWKEIRGLREKAPHDPAVLLLSCAIASRREGGYSDAKSACEQAAAILSDRPAPLLELTELILKEKRHDEAAELLAKIRDYCSRGQCRKDERIHAANLHVRAHFLTFAEELVVSTSTTAGASVLAQVSKARKYYRPPAKLAPENEGDYLRSLEDIEDLLRNKGHQKALQLIAAAEKRKLGSARLDLAACRAHLAVFAIPRAQKACRAALAKDELDPQAHFYSAVLARAAGDTSRAKRHAERALKLDPELKAAKALLAQ
jgi:tetratricopeptide (TPR) repeat protein